MASSRRDNKKKLVAIFGGCCIRCSYNKSNEALHFHHRDPATKLFSIGTGNIKSFKRLLAEAEKCDLVCANCHAEIHEETGRLS